MGAGGDIDVGSATKGKCAGGRSTRGVCAWSWAWAINSFLDRMPGLAVGEGDRTYRTDTNYGWCRAGVVGLVDGAGEN